MCSWGGVAGEVQACSTELALSPKTGKMDGLLAIAEGRCDARPWFRGQWHEQLSSSLVVNVPP